MEYINSIDAIQLHKPGVVTLGKFDGVHRGHQKIIHRVQEIGRQEGYRSIVFTFDVSPQVQMGARKAQMLMTNRERREILHSMGVDLLVECPFTDQIRNMEAEDFVADVLLGRLGAKAIIVGADAHFGRGRRGNPDFLLKMGRQCGFGVEVIEKERDGGRDISSSYVREELAAGHMEKVNELLGYPYFISGCVVHGRHLGHDLGFPTINQVPELGKMLPPRGVYISQTRIEGRLYRGVTNIGTKPTVKGKEMGVETHLFDCSQNLYGKAATVQLLSFRRPEQKFSSREMLVQQLRRDIQDAREYGR